METQKKAIDSLMTEERTFPPSADLSAGAKADGVIFVPRDVDGIPSGQLGRFTPWRTIL